MKINKKSWHYRYMNLVCSDSSFYNVNDLCSYIRRFIGITFIYLYALFIASGLGFIVMNVLLHCSNVVTAWTFLPVGILAIGIISGLVVGIYAGWEKYSDYQQDKKFNSDNYKPNPFIQYVKDKHNKMCSFIEYED